MQNAFITQLLTRPVPAAPPNAVAVAVPAVELLGAPELDAENPETHDSALFDVVVEVNFYDGRRIRIPQQSTPPGWVSPF
jgi:hypothetical protein